MTKNITVIDAQGNIYEDTYPKRAKGLVKNGRANFIDETAIMLTCPPDITEDKQMKDTAITAFEQLKENSEPISENSRILSILESIREDTAFIKQALDSVPTVSDDQATALATIINARERSNVAMIELLQDMVAERFQ